MLRLTICLLLCSLLPHPLFAAQRQLTLEPAARQVPQHHKIEFSLTTDATYDNPYDPAQIDLRLQITLPSGKRLSVPAFYYQPYDRNPRTRGNGNEWLYPVGSPLWKVRFSPTEVGSYTCLAILKDRTGTITSPQASFQCLPSQDKGFIRVSTDDPRYLAFDDGTPFFPIAQNIAFVNSSYATIEKIRKLGANHANYARIWACAEDWALAIEARKSAWGRSWDWNPPIVLTPGQDAFHAPDLSLKLVGDADATLAASPTRPIALRPNTRYQLTGQLKTQPALDLSLDLGSSHTLSGKPQWSKFRQEFTTAPDQYWLSGPSFRLPAKGAAWLRNLSLTEAPTGPELLGEADINRPILGFYNQLDSFMLDQILEAAEQNGLYLQLTLLTRNHYMHLLANENSPQYDQAIAFAKQFIRYCIARWGYSTHLATWEYFNEMNPGLPTDRFYTELAQTFDQLDINRHLRATSTWSSPSKDYRHPQLSTVDHHYYIRPSTGPLWKDEVASVLSRWKFLQQHASGKPILFSEFGITDDNWQRAKQLDQDKDFVHLHNALWASALTGFASTVSHWYWDDIHKRDLYSLYQPIARFTADIPWTTSHLRPASATADKSLRIIGLQGDHGAYLWIADPQATWWNLAMEHLTLQPISNASLTLTDLPSAAYHIQWWDTRTGQILSQLQTPPNTTTLTTPIPSFTHDIACKILPSH